MSKTAVIFGLAAFLNYGSSNHIANRVDSVSGQKQIDCIKLWESKHPGIGNDVVYTWHSKQPNEQFVHTFDLRTLSNPAADPGGEYLGVKISNHQWASVENYYQTQKILSVQSHYPELQAGGKYYQDITAIINTAKNGGPMSAFKAVRTKLPNGRDINSYLGSAMSAGYLSRQDLDNAMLTANLEKYRQYPTLRADLFLIYANGKQLVEASPRDSYWGIQMVGNVPGKNMLGVLHEQVATVLSSEFSAEYANVIGK